GNGLSHFPQVSGTRLPLFISQCSSSSTSFSLTSMSTTSSAADDSDPAEPVVSPRIKFKRLDKTARNIMQVSPENKRRVTTIKGIVIARRNAGLNTTFRLRRLVAGIGVESLFPLYTPNIKEVVVLDKKKVRRAKLYYLRDRMNPLKNNESGSKSMGVKFFFVHVINRAVVEILGVAKRVVLEPDNPVRSLWLFPRGRVKRRRCDVTDSTPPSRLAFPPQLQLQTFPTGHKFPSS
ncbi:hypothetical protein V2J09_007604, partial [Rumex salicifolius]